IQKDRHSVHGLYRNPVAWMPSLALDSGQSPVSSTGQAWAGITRVNKGLCAMAAGTGVGVGDDFFTSAQGS
ncbi:MAG: hypothetical protein ACREXR_04240, partial [Gammaproteobacteria bacterium]